VGRQLVNNLMIEHFTVLYKLISMAAMSFSK
jgi:hypothetical protein